MRSGPVDAAQEFGRVKRQPRSMQIIIEYRGA
jgi:hypothetical protein